MTDDDGSSIVFVRVALSLTVMEVPGIKPSSPRRHHRLQRIPHPSLTGRPVGTKYAKFCSIFSRGQFDQFQCREARFFRGSHGSKWKSRLPFRTDNRLKTKQKKHPKQKNAVINTRKCIDNCVPDWSLRTDLNSRPAAYKAAALPTELRRRMSYPS